MYFNFSQTNYKEISSGIDITLTKYFTSKISRNIAMFLSLVDSPAQMTENMTALHLDKAAAAQQC